LLHLWVIALFAGLVLRESLKEPLLDGWLSDPMVAAVTVGAMVLIGGATHAVVSICGRRLLEHGRARDLYIAESALGAARWCAVAAHLFAVLALGWLDVLRRALGNIVALDEIVAVLPALLVFAWGWWALWPIECALRNVAIVRQLDLGGAIYPMPRRLEFVVLNLRHHVLVWLTPLLLVLAWSESTQWLTDVLIDRGVIPALGDDARASLNVGLEAMGVVLVFLVLGPLAMRFVWDTVRMPPGALRDRLLDLCRRHNVRVSEVLVWRTHGTMINGAVLGLTPAFRYVLLTDALLDSLPDEQVEAVMAHEVAHVRHRHIIWLAAVLLVTIAAVAWAAESMVRAMGIVFDDADIPAWLALSVSGASFAAALLVFGIVSRRFEWQADAFAAAHMSESLRMAGEPDAGVLGVTHDGAGAMQAALRSVAELNHVPLDRPSWRHGSIGVRVELLARLVGTPEPRFAINRTARAIKAGTFACICLLIGLAAVQFYLGA
jgi:STE24 endopeptidase